MQHPSVGHEIIDNFLDKDLFTQIQNLIVWNHTFPWYLAKNVAGTEEDEGFYATHTVYLDSVRVSNHYNFLRQLLVKLPDLNALIRVKINFYPQSKVIYEHTKHIDYKIKHKGALFSLNTCDGFTRLDDGTKIESVENRLILFDPSIMHNSTTTTNAKGRFNININYL